MVSRGGWLANLKHGVVIMTNIVSRLSTIAAGEFELWLKENTRYQLEGSVNNVFTMQGVATYKKIGHKGLIFVVYDVKNDSAIIIGRHCEPELVDKISRL